MSANTKQHMNTVRWLYTKVIEYSINKAKQTDHLDKHLAEKIRRAGETAKEVVEHIEKHLG